LLTASPAVIAVTLLFVARDPLDVDAALMNAAIPIHSDEHTELIF